MVQHDGGKRLELWLPAAEHVCYKRIPPKVCSSAALGGWMILILDDLGGELQLPSIARLHVSAVYWNERNDTRHESAQQNESTCTTSWGRNRVRSSPD